MLGFLLALGLCSPLVSCSPSAAERPTDDPTPLTRPARAPKLGIGTTANGLLPTLAAEWQLNPRFSLQARAGYSSHSFSHSSFNTAPYTLHVTQVATDAQIRYHFQGRKKALTGWYVAPGAALTYSHERAETSTGARDARKALQLSPQLQAGRQWIFGDHWLVDACLGISVQHYRSLAFEDQPRDYWDFFSANCVQLGYAF